MIFLKGYRSQYFLQPEFYISLHVDSLWPIVYLHFEKKWDNGQNSMLMVKGSESP